MKSVPETLLRLRLLALFLISLAAVTSALAGFHVSALLHPAGLLIPPVVLAAAALAGAVAYDRLSAFADRIGRARVRLGSLFYLCGILFALLAVMTGQEEATVTAVDILIFSQPALLLLAGLGRGYIGTLLNALVLSGLTTLAGGPPAAVAIASHAGLMVFFLCVDHPARMLSEYPVEEIPPAAPAAGRAAVLAGVTAGAMGAYFHLAPPQPYMVFLPEAAVTASVGEALGAIYRDLIIVSFVAAVVFYLLLRMPFGRSGGGESIKLEHVSARRRAEPAAPRPRTPAGDGTGWRGKVVRLYVRTLEQLAALGVRRRPDQTAQELASRLEPRPEADALTGLFMRARYGPEDLSEEEYRDAIRASAGIVARFRSGK